MIGAKVVQIGVSGLSFFLRCLREASAKPGMKHAPPAHSLCSPKGPEPFHTLTASTSTQHTDASNNTI